MPPTQHQFSQYHDKTKYTYLKTGLVSFMIQSGIFTQGPFIFLLNCDSLLLTL